jgi:UDP-GalNAc:undecaprenyl-phosphate GalNAc-1-phosphate transferase
LFAEDSARKSIFQFKTIDIGIRMRKYFQLAEYMAAIPIASLIAIFDRYEVGLFVPDFAWPMIIAFNAAFLASVLVINFRKAPKREESAWVTITTLTISFLIAFSFLTAFRAYFSLGYSITYIIIAVLWTLLINRLHQNDFFSTRLVLAKIGDWELLEDSEMLDLTERPDDLEPGVLNGLIIDYDASLPDNWKSAIARFSLSGKAVYHVSTFFEITHERIALSHLSSEFVFAPPPSSYAFLKRPVDICSSITLLLLLLMPLAIILLVVRLTSPGPAIYSQPRIGLNGRVFTLYKIRTMRNLDQDEESNFTADDDPRITRVGRLLRALRIDEWPQFWNVLKGDMSLIGPRPEQPHWVDHFRKGIPFYDLRHAVRPGITGWAQIKQGYASGVDESTVKLEYDLYYIKHLSPNLDLRIALRTLNVLVRQFGAK